MDSRPTRYAKLDNYDYDLEFAKGLVTGVSIKVDSCTDVDIADVASDITGADGNIYVEGHYLKFLEMTIEKECSRMVISVTEN